MGNVERVAALRVQGLFSYAGLLTPGLTWQQLPATTEFPPPTVPRGLVFDRKGQRLLMLHSFGELWSYRYQDLWPGEACFNGWDDDGDGAVDCVDPDCDGQTCEGGGTCVSGACVAP